MATTRKPSSNLANLISAGKIVEAIQADFTKVAAEAPQLIEALAKSHQVLTPSEKFSETAKVRGEAKQVLEAKADQQREIRKAHSEMLQNAIQARAKRLEGYAVRKRVVVKPKEGAWVVSGQVTDKSSGNGIPNLIVRAYDMDRVVDDYLGTSRTDALGYYRIEYTEEDFKDSGEGKPEVYILVLDDNKNVLYTSPKSFVEKSATVQKIDAQIEGNRVPAKLKLSNNVNSFVSKTLLGFTERRKVLEGRKIVVTKPVNTIGARLLRAQKAAAVAQPKKAELKPAEEKPAALEKTPVKKKPAKRKKLAVKKKKRKTKTGVKKSRDTDS